MPTTDAARLRPLVRPLAALAALALLATLVLPFGGTPAHAQEVVEILSLSGRADTVMGGDVLLEVVLPDDAEVADLDVVVDGRDVSDAFAARDAHDGRVIGLVDGLVLGENVITAELADGRGARLTVENHPQTGPVTSGPHIEPWYCDDGELGDCSREPTYELLFVPASGGDFQPYDESTPDEFVATTTTDEGLEVPFIVRVETGVIARDEYRIAVLFDPEQEWTATEPQPQWNNKTVITHGASCDTSYQMGSAPDVLLQDALGRGFAVISHALDNAGHNCNIATQAESLIMTKERLADQYGPIRYTIGSGCSGGSLTQQQVANAYPGIYQGISPQCSFADAWSTANQYVDYVLLRNYFEGGSATDPTFAAPDPEFVTGMGAVYGHPNPANPITFTEVIPNSGEPTRSCPGVPEEDVYDEDTNPDGVRCTLQDYMVNVFGVDPTNGFARRPFDNTGIQYGLAGLQRGTLSFDAFASLNRDIGGFDIDLTPEPQRIAGDTDAIAQQYRSGANNVGNNMDEVAIIDLRGPDDGAFHDAYRTSVMEARLEREQGHTDNHVRWEGSVPLLGDVNYVDEAIVALDSWLAEIEADDRDVPLAQKVVDARTAAGVEDRCTNGAGVDAPQETCDAQVREYSSPRIEAGMPLTDDVTKCQLVAVRDFDYGDFAPTEEQLLELEEIFPDGVCDYSRAGVAATDTEVWMTYEDGPGQGRSLGVAPVSVPFGPTDGGTTAGDGDGPDGALAATGGGTTALALVVLGGAALLGRRRQT